MENYSKEFVHELSRRLLIESNKEPNRELCRNLLHRKISGEILTISRLDKATLETLFIKELCTDAMVGALFDVNNRKIRELRESQGLTDDKIIELHTLYIAASISSELEHELGDRAFG